MAEIVSALAGFEPGSVTIINRIKWIKNKMLIKDNWNGKWIKSNDSDSWSDGIDWWYLFHCHGNWKRSRARVDLSERSFGAELIAI